MKSSNEARSLTHAICELKASIEHSRKDLLWAFLRGIMSVLGALTAAAILIPLSMWFLRGIELVPIFGDVVSRIVEQVEQSR